MAFHLLNENYKNYSNCIPTSPGNFKNLPNAHAAITSYLFILVRVRDFQAQGDLGGEELGLKERTENKDIHIFWGGFKHGDHTLGKGGTWTSIAGPDQESEVAVCSHVSVVGSLTTALGCNPPVPLHQPGLCCWNIWVTGSGRAPHAAPHGLVLLFLASCFMHGPLVLGINTGCILLIPYLFVPIPLCSVIVRQTEVLLISATPWLFNICTFRSFCFFGVYFGCFWPYRHHRHITRKLKANDNNKNLSNGSTRNVSKISQNVVGGSHICSNWLQEL
jgi:hypothetical protein